MSSTTDSLRADLMSHIEDRDRDGAVAVALETIRSGALTVPQLYDLLSDLLAEVGASWSRGETEVWQEHYATAVVRTIVGACQPLVAERVGKPNGLTVILATPAEEYHDLGVRMMADRFALAGWSAQLLGANVPLEELLHAVRALEADAVVLSVYTHFHRVTLRHYVDTLSERHPHLRLWVGGAAFAVEHDGWPDEMLITPADVPTLSERMV
ncbi:MAG: cobalamin B12-binding domain-containing protein [Coriobacteriia bacterium]